MAIVAMPHSPQVDSPKNKFVRSIRYGGRIKSVMFYSG